MSQKVVQRNHLLVLCSLLSIFTSSVLSANDFDYCSITKKHTMCTKEGYGPSCGKALGHGISASERNEIVRVHNELRAKLANGQESFGKPGPQPPAADMETMVWDDELARVAQKHADQCLFAHDCADCRKIPRFNVGQNLYIYKQSIREAATNWTAAVSDWYYEVKLFDKNWVKPFKFSLPIGHYTAMVWSNTNRVGCGLTAYVEGKWFVKLYTCDYGPAGNYIGGQMYENGKACSKCPSGTSCSREYPGLCASSSFSSFISNEISNDVFDEPISTIQEPLPSFSPSFTTSQFNPIKNEVFNPIENRFTPIRKTTTKRPRTILTSLATTPKTTPRTTTTPATTTTPTTTTTTAAPITTFTFTFPTTTTTFSTTTRQTTTTTPRTTTTRASTTPRTTTPRFTTSRTTTARPSRFFTRLTTSTTAQAQPTPSSIVIRNEFIPSISEDQSFVFDDSFQQMFKCNFDQNTNDCQVKFSGKDWILKSFGNDFGVENNYYEVTLNAEEQERTELFFGEMIPPPPRGIACLNFRYKKFQTGRLNDAPLQVVVWPFNGKPGIVKIQRNSPDGGTWIRAQVTFRKISNSFVVLFRADSSKTGLVTLALDDVSVSEGNC